MKKLIFAVMIASTTITSQAAELKQKIDPITNQKTRWVEHWQEHATGKTMLMILPTISRPGHVDFLLYYGRAGEQDCMRVPAQLKDASGVVHDLQSRAKDYGCDISVPLMLVQQRFYLRYPTKSGLTLDFDVDTSRVDWSSF